MIGTLVSLFYCYNSYIMKTKDMMIKAGIKMAKATLQTVDRALKLLEILAEHPKGMQPKEIEEILELNKVTVHRLLATLENRGFVERIGNSYVIGLKVVELSNMKLSNVGFKTEE